MLPTAALSDIRIFRRWISDDEARLLAQDYVLKKRMQSDTAWNELEPRDRELLTEFYNATIDDGYRSRLRELSQSERRRDFKQEDDRSRAQWMLQAVLSRPAEDVDVAQMASVADEFRVIFQHEPETAKELINTGDSSPDEKLDAAELAAWTMVANILMNRDDFINK